MHIFKVIWRWIKCLQEVIFIAKKNGGRVPSGRPAWAHPWLLKFLSLVIYSFVQWMQSYCILHVLSMQLWW
jgi:hypothetical protein